VPRPPQGEPGERPPREADVILDVVFEDGLLFLSLANIGDAPAHGVRVRFEEPFSGLGGSRRIDRLALFRKLEFLAPRKAIRTFLDRSAAYFARDEPTTLTARVSWRTAGGERRSLVIRHDLDVYRDLAHLEREVPDRADP
jgi:hypothetical protein